MTSELTAFVRCTIKPCSFEAASTAAASDAIPYVASAFRRHLLDAHGIKAVRS